jgi:hypothetical protein
MKFLLTLSAALFCAMPQLSAQQVRAVKLRAICFQHVGDLKKLLAMSGGEDGGKPTEFNLYTSSISDEVSTFATDGMLTFSVQDGEEGGKPKYRTIATAKAAPGTRQLAIFIPGDPQVSPYRCFVIDDSEKAFPMGSTMAVNLSNVALRLSIGEHLKAVAPGKVENIPMARKANERGQVSVVISIADAAGPGGWRAVNQTRWFTGTDKRDLAIGFIHPKTNQPTVNCYGDTPPWIVR